VLKIFFLEIFVFLCRNLNEMIMATITLQYNSNNTLAKSIINSVKAAGVFQITDEKSPYNKEFVEKIQESRKSEGTIIKTEDLWR